MFRARRLPALLAAASAASLSLWGLGVGLPAASAATAANINPCGPLFTDASGDAGGNDQVDIVAGSATDTGSTLTTVLTVKALSTTVVSGRTANEYYTTFTGADGSPYFTNAEVSATGDVTYSYGTQDATTGAFSAQGDATGTFDPAHNAVSVTVPLAVVGGGAAGTVISQIGASTYGLVGAPGNPTGVSGGSLQPIDTAAPQYDYQIGESCGGTPSETPSPTATETTPATCTTLCFSSPIVLPKSGQAGNSSFTDPCYSPCGEPSLAVSPVDGTMYVSTPRTIVICCNTQASPVWKSTDNGQTWSDPIFPSGAENATTGGDTELAIDKRGTVYEGELWLGSDSIYISGDKGSTWDWSPASHDVGADREWFAYSPQEDALYGWYDGFKGLMVVKAPLSTPLGSQTARFFPQEQIAVPECVAGLAVNCPNLPADEIAGKPILPGTVSPGRPSVSPVDGTVYFPFPYQVAGDGVGLAETTDGLNFTYAYVNGAGHGDFGDTGNDFPVSAVDSAGRVYVAWVEDKGDGYNLYLASSGDKGQTWTTPIEVSKGISNTAVFPNVVAGAPGQVAVSWYGTDTAGDMNTMPSTASWNVYVSEISDAAGSSPTPTTGVVEQGFHHGVICTMGTGCSGNGRMLLDFFDMQFDQTGALGVVYTRDQAGKAGRTEIAYSHQVSGCVLTAASCAGLSTDVAEFPSEAVPVMLGALLIGSLIAVRSRRRGAVTHAA